MPLLPLLLLRSELRPVGLELPVQRRLPGLPHILAAGPRLKLQLLPHVPLPDHLLAPLLRIALGAHAEEEVGPVRPAVFPLAVPVAVHELAAHRLAEPGVVEGVAAGHGRRVEAGEG